MNLPLILFAICTVVVAVDAKNILFIYSFSWSLLILLVLFGLVFVIDIVLIPAAAMHDCNCHLSLNMTSS